SYLLSELSVRLFGPTFSDSFYQVRLLVRGEHVSFVSILFTRAFPWSSLLTFVSCTAIQKVVTGCQHRSHILLSNDLAIVGFTHSSVLLRTLLPEGRSYSGDTGYSEGTCFLEDRYHLEDIHCLENTCYSKDMHYSEYTSYSEDRHCSEDTSCSEDRNCSEDTSYLEGTCCLEGRCFLEDICRSGGFVPSWRPLTLPPSNRVAGQGCELRLTTKEYLAYFVPPYLWEDATGIQALGALFDSLEALSSSEARGSVLDRLCCVLADLFTVALSGLYANEHFEVLCVQHRRLGFDREMGYTINKLGLGLIFWYHQFISDKQMVLEIKAELLGDWVSVGRSTKWLWY
nr:hypothetical protein [Tanacetum cinerariifolium]